MGIVWSDEQNGVSMVQQHTKIRTTGRVGCDSTTGVPSVRRHLRRGFTLVEILIVVVILGILAAIVLPQLAHAGSDAAQVAFIRDVRTFAEAAVYYRAQTGQYLEDSASGALPTGWEPYVQEQKWTAGTPIGGVWDMELNAFGITSGFGVHFNGTGPTRDDTYMLEVDHTFDDGDLNTGAFRKIADDRYYYILVG